MVKLDLGCGDNKREGFTGVDVVKTPSADVVTDLRYKWPFEDESVDEAVSSHFIEHLDGDELIHFMNELSRVLKKGAKAQLIAPYYSSVRAIQDPTHKQMICEQKFLYFNKGWRDANKLSHYPISADFDCGFSYSMSNARWVNASEESRMFAISHYRNVIDDLVINLVKR